jgi:hypothetical protein
MEGFNNVASVEVTLLPTCGMLHSGNVTCVRGAYDVGSQDAAVPEDSTFDDTCCVSGRRLAAQPCAHRRGRRA